MNWIVIDPHFCSREEFNELKEYLNNSAWDWKELKQESAPHLRASLDKCADMSSSLIDAMPYKGDSCEDSQRVCLRIALSDFEANINGITDDDLKDEEE